MKVLSVSTHFNIGGISNYILALAGELKKKDVSTIVATSGGGLVPELHKLGIEHRFIPVDTKFEFNPKLIIAAMQLKKIIQNENIDLIHAHTRVSQVAALLASKMTGVPVVTTCHGYFEKRLRKVFDTWGTRVIAISNAVRDHLIIDLGVSEDRVRLVYSGVDPDRFARQYSDAEIAVIKKDIGLKDAPVVGTIGRLSSVKGHTHLLDALGTIISKLPEVQGLIIGDGPEREPLLKQAETLGIKDSVKFISSDVDTPRFLAVMDVFIFPSLKEGLGIALLEAMAAGKSSVASKTGGISDIISDGSCGMLVGVADPKGIVAAVMDLLEDPAKRRMMGAEARRLVQEKFTLNRMALDIAHLYKDTISLKTKA